MKRLRRFAVLFLFLLLLVPSYHADAAAKYPTKITLNKKTASMRKGTSLQLKAVLSPEKVKKSKVTWSSSNKKVATVSSKGKVTARGGGTAKITARTANGRKAVCKVTVTLYSTGKSKITILTPVGKRTYRNYTQNQYGGYYPSYGCVTTAVSIAASACGKEYSPVQIHTARASKKYGERYAVRQLGGSASLYGKAAISLAAASRILTNMGIRNETVWSFTAQQAVDAIRAHLASGKPVIAKANNQKADGVRIANGHHAIVLIGLEADGTVDFIDPMTGRVNYAHASSRYCNLTLEELVRNHMDPAVGNTSGPYVTGLKSAGGYILVGG